MQNRYSELYRFGSTEEAEKFIYAHLPMHHKMTKKIKDGYDDLGQHKMFLFSVPYFIIALLDLVTIQMALGSRVDLYGLYTLYYNPYFISLRLFAPVILIISYISLSQFTASERSMRPLGRSGCVSLIAMSAVYAIMCTSNLYHCVIAV